MNAYVIYPTSCAGRSFAAQHGVIPMIKYDRKLAAGLEKAVEDGDEIHSLEFLEYLLRERLLVLDMKRTPAHTVAAYLDTPQGQRALQAWAREEAEAEEMAV
ncbi:MAG: hypothetical protein R3215_07735 [Halomonas sp.]|nr:hypothetical protein [Halomonas sp.]